MDYPLINGNRYSWASVRIRVGSTEYMDVTEISYSHTMERGTVRGVGAQKLGMTRGEYDAEASITFLKEGFDQLVEALGEGYMEIPFDVAVTYADEGQDTNTDQLVGCRISSIEKNPSQGTDGLTVSCELDVQYIIENGVKPLRNMRT